MSTTIKCKGCGAHLQCEDEKKVGYALSLDHTYCQSCFRLLHYGESLAHFHPEDLPSLPSDSIIMMVSSVLHLDTLFSHPVYRYQPDATYIYIINQIDLLPKDTNLDHLLSNIKKKAHDMHVPYQDIILMSARNPYDMDQLKKYLESMQVPHVYLLGVQNSGKTTLFKALTEDKDALAMKKAGLTQEALKRPYKHMMIYDMPGLYQEGYLHHVLPYGVYKNLIPDQEIRPKVYQLKNHQALMLEGLISISFYGDKLYPVFYLDQHIKIHKTNDERIKPLLQEKEKHFNIYVDSYETKTFKLKDGAYHITFADMGFMHLSGPARIEITYPKGLHITLSEALFND